MAANEQTVANTCILAAPANREVCRRHTYGQILKSSALIGGSSVLRIGFSIVRNKAMALMLGPGGIGLLGLYSSIVEMTQSLSCMGINGSGVRQIAEAVGTGDTARIARTVTTLRRIAVVLGLVGAVGVMLFSHPISRLSFGDDLHARAVAWLGVAVFCGAVTAGQGALIQGMRRIADLALMSVLGAMYGTVFYLPILYFFGEKGIVPSLLCVGVMAVLTSWWYSRKIEVERVAMRVGEMAQEAAALLRLGVVLMASSLMTMGLGYLVRIIVLRRMGIEAAGHYQAAWSLGGLYVGLILQAMAADFFPRLTAAANNQLECNRLVNEQAEVGLLLAGPGLLGTLTFAPLVIQVFYSGKFGPAVEILRWICLGMIMRVASWPMGFILLAKNERKPFFCSEFAANLFQLTMVWMCVAFFGLSGTGVAFFLGYIFYWCLIYLIVRRVSGFRWSKANKKTALIYIQVVAPLFVGWYFLPHALVAGVGVVVTAVVGIHSLRRICTMVPSSRLPGPALRLLRLLRIAPAEFGIQK